MYKWANFSDQCYHFGGISLQQWFVFFSVPSIYSYPCFVRFFYIWRTNTTIRPLCIWWDVLFLIPFSHHFFLFLCLFCINVQDKCWKHGIDFKLKIQKHFHLRLAFNPCRWRHDKDNKPQSISNFKSMPVTAPIISHGQSCFRLLCANMKTFPQIGISFENIRLYAATILPFDKKST